MLARTNYRTLLALFLSGLFLLTGCQDMQDQPRYEPLEASEFFSDMRSARPLVAGAVPWQDTPSDPLFLTGRTEDGELSNIFPFEVTLEVLQEGQESYNVFCAPCHGFDGRGQGMIVQRGFRTPSSFHDQRLQDAPVGHFYDVITNGFGSMYAYAYRIPPSERWAIVGYIRALQLSQNADSDDLPAEDRQQLQEAQP